MNLFVKMIEEELCEAQTSIALMVMPWLKVGLWRHLNEKNGRWKNGQLYITKTLITLPQPDLCQRMLQWGLPDR